MGQSKEAIVDGVWSVLEHGKPIHGVSMKRESHGLITVWCSMNMWCDKDRFRVSPASGLRVYKTCDDCREEDSPFSPLSSEYARLNS